MVRRVSLRVTEYHGRLSPGRSLLEMIPFRIWAKNTEVLVSEEGGREGGREQNCPAPDQVCAKNKGDRIYCNGTVGRRIDCESLSW